MLVPIGIGAIKKPQVNESPGVWYLVEMAGVEPASANPPLEDLHA